MSTKPFIISLIYRSFFRRANLIPVLKNNRKAQTLLKNYLKFYAFKSQARYTCKLQANLYYVFVPIVVLFVFQLQELLFLIEKIIDLEVVFLILKTIDFV